MATFEFFPLNNNFQTVDSEDHRLNCQTIVRTTW